MFLSKRNSYRIFRHHLPLALVSAASIFIFYSIVQSDDEVFRWSLATGYVGIALLGATLFTGPLKVIRKLRNPVSTDSRRDMGIWCGIISVAHVILGLQVHMGQMILYFFREVGERKSLVPRVDLFGFANYTGLAALLVISVLLLLSNDISLRRVGQKRWKSLQRWNYAVFVLVVIHSVAYQITESRHIQYLLLFGLIVGITSTAQILGFLKTRKAKSTSPERKASVKTT